MKRAHIILAVFIASTAWYGCGVTKKSTMHRLKNKADVIDSMLLPTKEDSKSAKPAELIDAQKIKSIPKSAQLKKVHITRNNAPLL